MIDLKSLERDIDALLETETKESLEKWLFSKRYQNINKILGNGKFVSLQNESVRFTGSFNQPKFKHTSCQASNIPYNRLAA